MLYFAHQQDFPAALLEGRCLPWLGATERARYQRLQLPVRRHAYLLGQTLLRIALGQWAGVHPAQWQFTATRHGKPVIKAPLPVGPCSFNLSHSAALAVVAVSNHAAALGVDIEHNRRQRRWCQLARRHFSAAEVKALQALPPRRQAARCYALWTLKEAYVKAIGSGLTVSLPAFGFEFCQHSGQLCGFRVDSFRQDTPVNWQFRLWQVATDYRLALAVGGNHAPGIKIRAQRFDTLHSSRPVALRELGRIPRQQD